MGQDGKRRKRLARSAGVSVVALASLLGAAPAQASGHEVCVECPEPLTGTDRAFMKHLQLGSPGATLDAAGKWHGQTAFNKVSTLGFPGNSEDAFSKS